jgi:hypothetical protein
MHWAIIPQNQGNANMAVSDYSTTPGSNVTISGINIAEGCAPANINNAIRQIMADVKTEFTGLPAVTGKLDAAGGVFTGAQPIYTGRGAYLHHSASTLSSGRVSILTEGSANPTSPSEGDIVLFYTP